MFAEEAIEVWKSGGWLMAPLLALTVYIYYIALELLLWLNGHFLIKSRVHSWTDGEIAARTKNGWSVMRSLLVEGAISPSVQE